MGNDLVSKYDIPFGIGIFKYDENWLLEQENDEFCQHIGYSHEKLRSNGNAIELFDPKYHKMVTEFLDAIRGGNSVEDITVRLLCHDGKRLWSRISYVGDKHSCDDVIVLFNYIEKEKELEQKLELIENQLSIMRDVTDETPFDLDVTEWKLLRSRRLMQAKGLENASDEFFPFAEEIKQLHPLDQEKFASAMKVAAGGLVSSTIDTRFNVAQDNMVPRYAWYRTHYRSVADSDGRIVRVIGRSYNIDKNIMLEEKAKRDPMTKLLNKMEVENQVTEALCQPSDKPNVLFLIDIDNFKGINDTFGHTFGDTVISDIANILSRQFRTEDIVGRVGGDEFLVLMRNVTVEKAELKAKNLCRALTKEYTGGEIVRKITTSIGLAVSGTDGYTYKELFDSADRAMYRTKQSGKNGFSLARGEDDGPIRKNKEHKEQREILNDSEKDFMVFAVNLLTHARNIDASLNLLVQKMAEEFGLDLVAICENSPNTSYAILTNYYSKLINFYEKTLFQRNGIEDLIPEFGKTIVVKNPPLESWIESAEYQGSTIPRYLVDNTSVAASRFEFASNRTGAIFFYRFGTGKEWQQSELNFLGELTRTIGLFVTLRSRIEESNTEIRRIQNRDQLTGFATFEAFKSVFSNMLSELPESKVKALCYFDINNFGYINENYGHQVGDNVLKFLAQDISEQSNFVIGCRLYSDFFLMMTMGDDRETLKKSIVNQQKRFTNMQNHQYPSSGLSISTGLFFIDSKRIDADVAMENANLAWKEAKRTRKNDIVVFENSLREQRIEEQQIIAEFYEALYRADFKVYLQPKFNLNTGEVYGAEALSRWRKPDGKIYTPAKYIDVLEKIGYITELDFYMYEEVLRNMTKWRQQHRREIVVSINFSGRHFDGDAKDFLNRITMITNKYSIEPRFIEIEITEGVIAKNYEGLLKCMNKLRERGFRVAIDDFGTGYSSLFILTDLPADVVKVDKSFLDKEFNQRNVGMIRAMGDMVSIAEKDIIFEGIETEAQRETLVGCGFKYGQGYLCNKPVSVGKFEKLYL